MTTQDVERVFQGSHLSAKAVVFGFNQLKSLDSHFFLHGVHGAVIQIRNVVGNPSGQFGVGIHNGDLYRIVLGLTELYPLVVKLVEFSDGIFLCRLDAVMIHQVVALDNDVAYAV